MNIPNTPRRQGRTPRTASAPLHGAVNDETLQNLVDFFQLLADRSRLRIILTLAQEGEQNVTALCNRLGQSQPAVSHHLTQMRRRGLLSFRREGKHNYYALASDQLSELLRPLLNGATTPAESHLGELIGSLNAP